MESTPDTYFGMENGIPFISPWQNPLMAVMLQQDMLKSGYGPSEANELATNIVAAMQPRLIIDDDDDCFCCFGNNSLQYSYSKPTQPRRKKKKAPQRNLKSLREAIREQKKLEWAQSARTKVHEDVKDTADDVNMSQQSEKKLKKTKNQGKSKTFKRQTKRPGRV